MDKVTIITINNPFDRSDREIDKVEYIPKGSMKSYLLDKEGMISENNMVASVNGSIVPYEEWNAVNIKAGDCLSLCPTMGKSGNGKQIASLIAGIALSVVSMGVGSLVSGGAFMGKMALGMGAWSWGGYIAALAVMYVGGILISKMQPQPELDLKQAATRYSWSPAPMAIGQGYPLNIIYGTVRPTPLILAQHIDDDGMNQYFNILLCLGEGPIDSISNIKINGNPLSNYTRAYWDYRKGENNQSVMPNFSDTFAEQTLSFELVPAYSGQETPWSYQETEGDAAQGLEIVFSFSNGLYHTNSEGSVEQTSVTLQAEYRRMPGGAWTPFFDQTTTPTNTKIISDSSTSPTRRVYRVDDIPTGKYSIRTRCIAKSSSLITTVNKVYWTMLSSIIYDDFQRPGKVLLAIKILANSQISGGIPTISCTVTRSTVYVWNPTTSSYEIKSATNPAWAAYDMIHRAKLFPPAYWEATILIDGTLRTLKISTYWLIAPTLNYNIAAISVRQAVNQYDPLATAVWSGGVNKFVVGFSAVRIGGAGVSTNIDPWMAIVDGAFRIGIDGDFQDVVGINFYARAQEIKGGPIMTAGDMPLIAHIIQNELNRIGTGGFGRAVVEWVASTASFKIKSGSTGTSSTISALSTAFGGTDISGAAYMKMRSGQETSYSNGFTSTIDLPSITSEYVAFGASKEKMIYNDFLAWATFCDNTIVSVAFMTGGTVANLSMASWNAITNGSFRISVDGAAHDITGLDFSGAADLNAIAAIIQTAVNAVGTGGYPLVTVEWMGANFKIKSGQLIVASNISALSAASTGSDISGSGYMNCQSGTAILSTPKGLKINYIVDKISDLWSTLKEFENCGRGKVITRGTRFGCICDAPGTPVMTFTMGNIVRDSFRIEYLPTKDLANALEITFNNEEKDFQRDIVPIYSDDYYTSDDVKNPTQVTYNGITSRDQAFQEGEYRLRSNAALKRTIYFDADVDAIGGQVGDLINFQHDVPKWGVAGGRCLGVDAATLNVIIDTFVTLEAYQAYTFLFRHPLSDATIMRTVAAVDHDRIDISVIPITVALGDSGVGQDWIYALGKENIQTKPFRFIHLTRSEKMRRKLTCLEYVESVYTGRNSAPEIQYVSLPTFDEVNSLMVSTDTFTQKDGSVMSVIYVNWRVSRNARNSKVIVFYSPGVIAFPDSPNANWIKHNETGALNTTIESVAALQNYTVKVCVMNDLGVTSPGVIRSIYISGKDAKPDRVTGVTYSIDPANRTLIKLDWDKIINRDLRDYEVTIEVAGLDAVVIRVPSNTYTYSATFTGGRTITVKIKAVDNSGNKSELDGSVSFFHKNEPADVTGFAAVLSKYNYMSVDLYWNANADSDIAEYIIYKDDANAVPLDANILWRGNATARTVNLENGIHTLKIYAKNAAGFRSLNPAVATFKIDFIPGNVTGLTATRDTTYRNRINLAWDGTTETYEHCYHIDITSEYQKSALDITKDLTTAVFKALDSGSHYVFSLVAKNSFGPQISATPSTASITTNFAPNNVTGFNAVVDNGKKVFADSYIYNSMAKIDGTSAIMAAQDETLNSGKIIKLTGLDGVITAADTIDLIAGGGAVKGTAPVLIDATSALVAYIDSSDAGYVVKVSGLDATPSIGSPVKFSTDGESVTHLSLALIGTATALVAFGSSNTFHRGQLAKITGLDGTLAAAAPETYSTFETRHNALIGIDSTSAMLAYADYSDMSGTPKVMKITGLDGTPALGTPVAISSTVYYNFIKGVTGLSAIKINSTTALIAGSSSVQLIYAVKIHGLDGTLTFDEPVGYDVDYGYTTPVLALVNSTSALLTARDATHAEGIIFNIQGLDGTLSFGVNKFRYNYLSQDATHAALITISGTKAIIVFKNIVTGVCNAVRVENIDSLVIPTFSNKTAYLSWTDITDKFPGDFYTVEVGDTDDDWWSALPWSGDFGPDSSAITGLTARYNNINGAASLKFFIRAVAAQAPELGAAFFSPAATEITVTF